MVVHSESVCKYPRYQPCKKEVRVMATKANRPDHWTPGGWDHSLTVTLHIGPPSRQSGSERALPIYIALPPLQITQCPPPTAPHFQHRLSYYHLVFPVSISTTNPPLPTTDGALSINCRTANSTTNQTNILVRERRIQPNVTPETPR